jgi:hypothetical protein
MAYLYKFWSHLCPNFCTVTGHCIETGDNDHRQVPSWPSMIFHGFFKDPFEVMLAFWCHNLVINEWFVVYLSALPIWCMFKTTAISPLQEIDNEHTDCINSIFHNVQFCLPLIVLLSKVCVLMRDSSDMTVWRRASYQVWVQRQAVLYLKLWIIATQYKYLTETDW